MLREGLLQYWWMLYRHAKVLNQRTDIFRNIEDAFAAKHGDLCLREGRVHVDIGSGSSPVPTFLYQRRHATTYATEMDRAYLDRQENYAKILGLGKRDRFLVRREDATRLSFADSSVDFVTAVSTIEHIPGDGDVRAMTEFARVLRPGGRVVVTVPTAANYIENQSTFYYAGFERRYDPAALQSRLFCPGLKLIEQLYMVPPPEEFMRQFRESFAKFFPGDSWSDTWYKNGWHDQYPDVSILLSVGLIRLSPNPEGSFGGCLAMEKQ
jgi:SAM-dependent methyltransferase